MNEIFQKAQTFLVGIFSRKTTRTMGLEELRQVTEMWIAYVTGLIEAAGFPRVKVEQAIESLKRRAAKPSKQEQAAHGGEEKLRFYYLTPLRFLGQLMQLPGAPELPDEIRRRCHTGHLQYFDIRPGKFRCEFQGKYHGVNFAGFLDNTRRLEKGHYRLPRAGGGTDHPLNLTLQPRGCNRRRHDKEYTVHMIDMFMAVIAHLEALVEVTQHGLQTRRDLSQEDKKALCHAVADYEKAVWPLKREVHRGGFMPVVHDPVFEPPGLRRTAAVHSIDGAK